jgi:hypothetical protein
MGTSRWSDDFYRDRVAERARTGADTFAYHTATVSAPVHERKVHASLDPKGVKIREARDSREHPESIPIGVMLDVTGSMLDVTGSMHTVPRTVQASLPKLMGLITSLTGITDQQILFGAVGDATSDQGSLQIGQFESGIEMDNDISNFWLESGGGGSNQESYQNAMYFFARHTVTDQWEKRNKKGYLFMLGDEHPYPKVRRDEIDRLIGPSLEADIPTEDIVRELKERYHVFFLIPRNTSHGRDPHLRDAWVKLLGEEYVLNIDDEGVICETIAVAVGLVEGRLTEDALVEVQNKYGRVLAPLAKMAAKTETALPVDGKTVRL